MHRAKHTNTWCCDVLFDYNDCACVVCRALCRKETDDKRTKQKRNWTELHSYMLPLNRAIHLIKKQVFAEWGLMRSRQCIIGIHTHARKGHKHIHGHRETLTQAKNFMCAIWTPDWINSLSHFIIAKASGIFSSCHSLHRIRWTCTHTHTHIYTQSIVFGSVSLHLGIEYVCHWELCSWSLSFNGETP